MLRLKTQRKLHDLLSDRHIVLDPPAHSVHEVFNGLSKRAAEVTAVTDPKLIFREVWARERAMHTTMPGGLAVPHARLDGLKKPHVFVAHWRDGIDLHAPRRRAEHARLPDPHAPGPARYADRDAVADRQGV